MKPCIHSLELAGHDSASQRFVSTRWDLNSKKITLAYMNKFCDEKGVIVLRAINKDSNYVAIDTMMVSDPFDTTATIWVDSNIQLINALYYYKFALYNDSVGPIYSRDTSVFSLDTSSLLYAPRPVIRLTEKVGSFPVYYGSRSWMMKKGDSILVKDSNTTNSMGYTIVDVSDPANPTFKGYHTSILDQDIFFHFFSKRNAMFVWAPRTYYSFVYNDTGFVLQDSIDGPFQTIVGEMDDTTLLASLTMPFSTQTITVKGSTFGSLHTGLSVSNSAGMVFPEIYNIIGRSVIIRNYISNGYGGLTRYTYDIWDFRDISNPKIATTNYVGQLPPPCIRGFFVINNPFDNPFTPIIDTTAKLVFGIEGKNSLCIYKYESTTLAAGTLPYESKKTTQNIVAASLRLVGRNSLLITTPEAQQMSKVRIYNMQGRMILEESGRSRQSCIVPLPKVGPGIYIVEIMTDKYRATKQLIIP
jgi:hypothetical protein